MVYNPAWYIESFISFCQRYNRPKISFEEIENEINKANETELLRIHK